MILYFFLCLLLLGRTMVFYSLSPYYAALGLVMSSLFGCIVLRLCGVSFLSLLLLLIYIGGMLVVFIYSSALSADRFPVIGNFGEVIVLFFLVLVWGLFIFEDFLERTYFLRLKSLQDLLGLGVLYRLGGFYLLVGGLCLLVVLVVVLIISFSFSDVNLRAL